MPDYDLLVLGDCNPDLVLTGDEVEPVFGQVERLVEGAELTIGGSAAIMACGAARLGLRTALIGVVGDDLFGRFMRDALAQRGVDTRAIVVDPDARTGLTVVLARPEDRAMLTFPGTISALSADGVDRGLLAQARHVHVASYFLQTALAPALPELFQSAHAAGATTSIDPNWDPAGDWDGGLHDLLSATDVFMPNAAEATRIARALAEHATEAGTPDAETAAAVLAARGPMTVVKLGSEGALAVRAGKEPARVQALAGTTPVDTIGAGDSFDAGFLSGLLGGLGIERSLALGSACGSLSTRAMGGTPAQPTLAQAQEALAALVEAP